MPNLQVLCVDMSLKEHHKRSDLSSSTSLGSSITSDCIDLEHRQRDFDTEDGHANGRLNCGYSDTPIVSYFDEFMAKNRNVSDNNNHFSGIDGAIPRSFNPFLDASDNFGVSQAKTIPSSQTISNSIGDKQCDPFNTRKLSDQSSILRDSDYDSKSEVSTLSSSPTNGDQTIVKIDPAILEEKFSKLGLDRYFQAPLNKSIRAGPVNGNENNYGARKVTSNDEVLNEDNDDDDLSRAPLIRSTSLKTGKTPPNTPGRKKVVRFADSLGIEIEYVKLISQDEVPTVPRSAFLDLKLTREENDLGRNFVPWSNNFNAPKTFVPEFVQPFQSINFYSRVRSQNVSLENCEISTGAGNISITCYVRVLNVSFEKQVTVRHTLTEWQTWTDSLASYLPNSCDGWSDKFVVTFYVRPNSFAGNMLTGQRLFFAVRYIANGEEYWDNNMGLNYSLIYR